MKTGEEMPMKVRTKEVVVGAYTLRLEFELNIWYDNFNSGCRHLKFRTKINLVKIDDDMIDVYPHDVIQKKLPVNLLDDCKRFDVDKEFAFDDEIDTILRKIDSEPGSFVSKGMLRRLVIQKGFV